MKTKRVKSKRIPLDLKRCQAEKPNGYTFMTLGGKTSCVVTRFLRGTRKKHIAPVGIC